MEILVHLVHPALLGLIGVVIPAHGTGYLVTEYMPNGSLDALIKDTARYAEMSPTGKAKIAVGIAIGMRYMHAAGVFHRDLKPSNILLDKNNEPRIGDLRIARFVNGGVSMTGGLGTSYLYSAPEIADDHYNEKVDVFSFAMIWWEIVTGKSVMTGFPGEKDPGMIAHQKRLRAGTRPHLDLNATADGILECLWDNEPDNRLSFAEFLDYAKENHYVLLDGADGDEVTRYVARLEEFEARNPAPDLRDHEDDE
jgi:serine/threonine protein kinase